MEAGLGRIVVLDGVPRSGKSSIAAAIQGSFDGVWMNLGVDVFGLATPERFRPGLGGAALRGMARDLGADPLAFNSNIAFDAVRPIFDPRRRRPP